VINYLINKRCVLDGIAARFPAEYRTPSALKELNEFWKAVRPVFKYHTGGIWAVSSVRRYHNYFGIECRIAVKPFARWMKTSPQGFEDLMFVFD